MNPASEITSAAKSAFSLKTLLVALFSFIAIAAIFDYFGVSEWLFKPFTKAKAKWGTPAASAVLVFATMAAATATNALQL
jgi:hypothetical protein